MSCISLLGWCSVPPIPLPKCSIQEVPVELLQFSLSSCSVELQRLDLQDWLKRLSTGCDVFRLRGNIFSSIFFLGNETLEAPFRDFDVYKTWWRKFVVRCFFWAVGSGKGGGFFLGATCQPAREERLFENLEVLLPFQVWPRWGVIWIFFGGKNPGELR